MVPRAWAALAVVATLATSARAQVATDELGIERFRPAMDRAGLHDVEWAGVPGHRSWGAGVLVGFAHDPLVVYDRQMSAVTALVDRRVTTSIVGSYALWNRLELGATVDVIGYQSGADVDLTTRDLPGGGVGDLRFVAKALLVGNADFQVSVLPALTVPGGSARGYLREAGVMFSPGLAVSGKVGPVRAAANAGYHLKSRVVTAGLVSDDEAFARIGLGLALGSARTPLVELSWSTSIATPLGDADRNQVAIEMLGGAARQLRPGLGVFVAGGVGLDNGFGTPDWRALGGVRFEAASGDRDGDRVLGASDRCPDEAEDNDGFEDDDGCPDLDNDGDGLADARDRCALEAEDKDGFQDDDGCVDLDNDGDGVADAQDRCPDIAEDQDGFQDDDGCVDAPSRVSGRVVDPDGRPIRGATVTIAQTDAPAAPPIELTAGEDGRFSTELHGGALQISARAPEYTPATATTTVAAGATGEVTINLVRAVRQGQLRGQVLSFSGEPLAATITIKSKAQATATATTDAEGHFTVELPEGAFSVEISSPGHVTQKRTVQIKLDGVTVLNVDLRSTK